MAADARDRVRPRDDDRSRRPYQARGRDRRGTRQLHRPLPSTRGNCRRRAHAGSRWARTLQTRRPTCATRSPTTATASTAPSAPAGGTGRSARPTGSRRPARCTRSAACGPESCDERGVAPSRRRRALVARRARARAARRGVLVGRRRRATARAPARSPIPGDCTPVDMAVSSEKIALLTDLARRVQRLGRGRPRRRQVRVRRACRSRRRARRCSCSPTAGRSRPRTGRSPVVWSPAASSWGAILNQRLTDEGRAGDGAAVRAVHAHAARDRDAASRWPTPSATPTRRSATPTSSRLANDPAGLGRVRPSRVGPVPARQDEPELLDERAVVDDRAVLRGDGQDAPTSRSRT